MATESGLMLVRPVFRPTRGATVGQMVSIPAAYVGPPVQMTDEASGGYACNAGTSPEAAINQAGGQHLGRAKGGLAALMGENRGLDFCGARFFARLLAISASSWSFSARAWLARLERNPHGDI